MKSLFSRKSTPINRMSIFIASSPIRIWPTGDKTKNKNKYKIEFCFLGDFLAILTPIYILQRLQESLFPVWAFCPLRIVHSIDGRTIIANVSSSPRETLGSCLCLFLFPSFVLSLSLSLYLSLSLSLSFLNLYSNQWICRCTLADQCRYLIRFCWGHHRLFFSFLKFLVPGVIKWIEI